jgi:hypothetical protein
VQQQQQLLLLLLLPRVCKLTGEGYRDGDTCFSAWRPS